MAKVVVVARANPYGWSSHDGGVERSRPRPRAPHGESPSKAVFVPWSIALEVVGHLLERADYYPARHRTLGFPNEAALDELRRRAAQGLD